jgi:hypothetical protein
MLVDAITNIRLHKIRDCNARFLTQTRPYYFIEAALC